MQPWNIFQKERAWKNIEKIFQGGDSVELKRRADGTVAVYKVSKRIEYQMTCA